MDLFDFSKPSGNTPSTDTDTSGLFNFSKVSSDSTPGLITEKPPTIDEAVDNVTPSIFDKIGSAVNKVAPDDSTLGVIKNTITGLPKAFWDFLGPGKIQDYLNTPEGQDAAMNLGVDDVKKNIIPSLAQVPGQIISDFTGKNINLKSKYPSISGDINITSIQNSTKDAVLNGENPFVAVVKAVPEAIFDGLALAGIMEKVFSPRESVVTTGVKTNDLPGNAEIPKTKSFRMSGISGDQNTVVKSNPLPSQALDALQQQGAKFSSDFDPKLPTYWRTTSTGGSQILGEVVQIKPSYFDSFKNLLKGDISKVPENEENVIYEKSTTLDDIAKNIQQNTEAKVPSKDDIEAVADEIKNPPQITPEASNTISEVASQFTKVTPSIEGLNPKQETKLTPEQVEPMAKSAADQYWRQVIKPSLNKGEPTVIGGDDLKDYFGKDYNDNNHPVYSKAAYLTFERALTENTNKAVVLTGGGPASGKTDLLIKNLKKSGFTGIIYDSNMASDIGVKKQVAAIRAVGKKPIVYGVLPNIDNSRTFSIQRENEIGRGISDKTFGTNHAGFPNVLRDNLEDGTLKESEVKLLDTREITSFEEALKKVTSGDYSTHPLALLQELEYNAKDFEKIYAKENYNLTTGERTTPLSSYDQLRIRGGFGKASIQNRSDQGNANGRGNEGLLGKTPEGKERINLSERPVELKRITEYKNRLKLKGADPVLVDAIITPTGGRAFGVTVGNNLIFENVVQQFTEDHEVFHQVFQNFDKMRLFKGFDKSSLLTEAKDLYGDLPEPQLEEEMAKDFQQYVHDQESGHESSFFGKIKEFFQKLYAALKRIFRTEKDINEFYRTMHEEKSPEETAIESDERLKGFIDQAKNTGEVDFRKEQYALGKFLEEEPLEKVFNDDGDLTLKTLTKLKGRSTVSKQFIEDLSNSGDIKQVERDLIRSILKDEPDTVNVSEFAERVKNELLPLEIKSQKNNITEKLNGRHPDSLKYESITLPDDIRGNVASYDEHIYESPIKTSAGNTHFGSDYGNYFGHTRIENMSSSKNTKMLSGGKDSVRRVIEVQSDLYQKGNLEKEVPPNHVFNNGLTVNYKGKPYKVMGTANGRTFATLKSGDEVIHNIHIDDVDLTPSYKIIESRSKEISKLQQYNDPTAHFRMVREEVKQAAIDGKTKLQFPTGETAMKIEGLGERNPWELRTKPRETEYGPTFHQTKLHIEDLKAGSRIYAPNQGEWIITDVLGDGKFKAVPENQIGLREREGLLVGEDINDIKNSRYIEEFDISGKVDTQNPIYKFYEKDLGRYLKNNYNAQPVTDDKGVTWMEVPVDPGYGDLPVPAFNKKTENIDQLNKMLEREQESLQIAENNPEMHAKVYGPERMDKYKARIAELKDRIAKAKNPVFNTGDKLKDIQKTLENVENRVGLKNAPIDFNGNTLKELEQRHTQLEAMKESIDNNPLQNLEKFEAKSGIFKGELPEVTGKSLEEIKQSKLYGNYRDKNVLHFMQRGDVHLTDAGYEDTEEGREAYQQFKDQKAQYKSILKNYTKDVKQYTDFVRQDEKSLEETGKQIPVTLEDLEPPIVRGEIQSPKLDFRKWKDKAILRLNRDTFERNLEKVAPKEDADKLKDFIVNPVRENELARIKFTNELKKSIGNKVKELGIKRNTTADELIQVFGEGKMTMTDLKKASPEQREQIQKAAAYFRNIYDDLIDTWNQERKRFGYALIPKLPNYFRHFDEINFFVKNYGFLRSQDELPTEIAGKTEFFKPGKPFSTAEMRRTGSSTKYSAIGGMNNYIESVSKQIFHIESVQRGRAVEKYLENAAKLARRSGEPLLLSNVAANLREYVNNQLAGKTATLDRALEGTLGRPTISAFQTISKLIGKNIIVGNISTALSHLVTLPLIGATTDKIPLTKGAMTTLTAPLKAEPFSIIDGQESSFLVRRFPLEEIQPTMPKTVEKALSYLFTVTDKFKSRLAVSSKYYEGIRDGLSPKEAMQQADIYAGKVIGDYSIGNKPNLMNAKTTSLLAQFQLGLNDSMSVLLHDIPEDATVIRYEEQPDGSHKEVRSKLKWQIASKLIQFAIFSYLFNQVIKKVRGSGKGIDPFDLLLTLFGLNDEGSGQSFPKRLAAAGTDLAGEIPFTSAFTGNFPLATALSQPIKDLLAGNYEKMAEGIAANFASPIGGGLQIKKTVEGAQAIKNRETSGVAEATRALFFGAGTSVTPLSQVSTDLNKSLKTAQTKLSGFDPDMVSKIQNDYSQAKNLGFDSDAAQTIVDNLSDTEYTVYKAVAAVDRAQSSITMESKVLPIVKQANDLGFDTQAADDLVTKSFPDTTEGDEEFAAYKSIKNSLYGENNQKNTSLGEWDKQSFITHVKNIATAVGTDPVTAFNDIFAGNSSWRLMGTKNGQVMVARMSEQESQAIKKSEGGDTKALKLDHSVALEAGGNNGNSNLQLIPTGDADTPGTWAWNSKTENMIGSALGSGKITSEQAREYMIRFKATAGEPLSPALQTEFKKKYNSEPLTPEEISDIINK